MKLLISFIVVLAGSFALRADEAAIIANVKAADDARVAAMIAGDAQQLDAVLSDELHYAHSVKYIEDKATHISHLSRLAEQRLFYQSVDYKTRDFSIVAPNVVMSKGRALVKVGGKRMIFLVDINFLAVWRLENSRWRLLAWQSSRNEEVVPLGPLSEVK